MTKNNLWIKLSVILGSMALLFNFASCENETTTPNNGESSWTIMFYFNADNNLESPMYDDLNELEAVDFSDEPINIIALFDRSPDYYTGDGNWTDTRLYEIQYDPAGAQNLSLTSLQLSSEELGLDADTEKELDLDSGV